MPFHAKRDRPLAWLHGEIKTPPFSAAARIEAGVLLRRLQRGESLAMPHSRPRNERKDSVEPFSTATDHALRTSSYCSGITPSTEANKIFTELNAIGFMMSIRTT